MAQVINPVACHIIMLNTYPHVSVSSAGDVLILPGLNRGVLFIPARDVSRWLKKPAQYPFWEWHAILSPAVATAMAACADLDIERIPQVIAMFTYPNGMRVAIVPNSDGIDLLALAKRVDMVVIPGDGSEVPASARSQQHGWN